MSFQETLQRNINHTFSVDFHVAIKKKLVMLLKKVCKIDISHFDENDPNYFQFDETYQHRHRIRYDFNYTGDDVGEAEAHITLDGGRFFVTFLFYKKEKHPSLPAGSHCVDIDVDPKLRYRFAKFSTRFDFGWQSADIRERGFFLFTKDMDSRMNVTTSIKCFTQNPRKKTKILRKKDLPAVFFENNHHFYDRLNNLLDYCEMRPKVFYEVFDEYPDHATLSKGSDSITSFLTLFHEQYQIDLKTLDSKLLLLEMDTI